MMKYICNPMNIEYRYQFVESRNGMQIVREAADPSLVMFKGQYYLFSSMAGGFYVSDDLADWKFYPLIGAPAYDYAPDVRVLGEYLYFSASNKDICSFYRSKDPIHGEFEEIKGTFSFWDPNLFADDNGRVYFYWGCSNVLPIYGVELDPETMHPLGEPTGLFSVNDKENGFERYGENHVPSISPEEVEAQISYYVSANPGLTEEEIAVVRQYMTPAPFLEGPWMDKHEGKYYLQYAIPHTEDNVYGDSVYVSDSPLGPFTLAKNNPYSYKPGGFVTGTGHGSTMEDKHGNVWHTASVRLSVHCNFERRIGLWPAGFDHDGELFCNQRYGDWPMRLENVRKDQWEKPEWMLLSYGKKVTASSVEGDHLPEYAVDENMRTWWKAATNHSDEWLEVDLGENYDIHAVQVNFTDDGLDVPLPEGVSLKGEPDPRYIDMRQHYTRWLLEGSVDGEEYFVIEDKSEAQTDLPHDLIVRENGFKARYIRCTVKELPFAQNACISGLRVFGKGDGKLPERVKEFDASLVTELDLTVKWPAGDALGYNVLWGFACDKLYHSYLVYGKNEVQIGALIKGQPVYVRIDAFNENGITEGEVRRVR